MTPAQQPAARAGQAEVLVFASADPQDMMFQKLLDMLVEYGIHIAADASDRLPRRLPADWSRYAAIVIDVDLPLAKRLAVRLERAGHQLGPRPQLVPYRKPAEFSWQHERPLYQIVDTLLVHHGVTPQNPAFLARNAGRGDRDVIRGQIDASFREEPQWLRRWCDSSLVRLEGMWLAAAHFDWPDVRRQVLACIDATLEAYAGAPVYGKGETANGLFKHPIYPGLLLPVWQDTGIVRYRDAALASMESLEEAREIAREWCERTPLLQCESLDRKPWQWAMRARWCAEPEFFGPAVDCMKAGFETLFDRQRNLWTHYGRKGGRQGLTWGRGQGWALYGLVGLLEHLPRTHPDFETMRSWLDLTAEGLRRTQDATTGLWHNVMGEPTTRLETSGTAKCIRHFARAWRLGLCRAPFVPDMLTRAWYGLKAHTFANRSCTRCYGTGPGFDVPFYTTIGSGGSYTATVQAGAEYVAAFGPLHT